MHNRLLSHSLASLLITWAVSAALLMALYEQLAHHDLPCALCWLQRFAMMGILVAQAYLLARIAKGHALSVVEIATAHGLSIVAAMAGISMSMRQILLHVLPGDPGYGGAILGMHLYTWAFLLFFACILGSALALALSRWLDVEAGAWRVPARFSLCLILAILVVNGLLVFAMQGFQWELDGDPTHYRLFQ